MLHPSPTREQDPKTPGAGAPPNPEGESHLFPVEASDLGVLVLIKVSLQLAANCHMMFQRRVSQDSIYLSQFNLGDG